jgi:putative hydrolase of HD superfamily
MKEIPEIFDESMRFLKILRELELVERVVYRPSDKRENDVEHSYQIAMMAWFLNNHFKLNLSVEKLLKYGLVHDLIEVYAGDTPAYAKNQTENTSATKKVREEEAFVRLKKEFDSEEFIQMIEDYEKKADLESRFVYDIDKLVPAMNIFLDKGYGWNKLNLNLSEIKEEKRIKIKSTKQTIDFLEEALSRFEREEDRLFKK